MAGSVGSISQYFPDVFGAGAPMSSAGTAATTSTAAGAASMGPLAGAMLGSAAIQGGASIIGGLMGQTSAREAIRAGEEGKVRDWGYNMYLQDRAKALQMGALEEGNFFMQSPIAQQNKAQDFSTNFMLSGKFDPYLTGMASRFRG